MTIINILLLSFIIFFLSFIFISGIKIKNNLPKTNACIFSFHSKLENDDYELWLILQRIYGNYCLKFSFKIFPFSLIFLVFINLFFNQFIIFCSSLTLLFFILTTYFLLIKKIKKELKIYIV